MKMKFTNLLIALTFVFAVACSGGKTEGEQAAPAATEEHSHEGGEAHSHDAEAPTQEDVTVVGDSTEVPADSTEHVHTEGEDHQH